MTDTLTHVLVAFAIGQLLAHRYETVTRAHVTALMAGALIPEMIKIGLVVPEWQVSALLGTKLEWDPLASVYGATLSVLVGMMLVTPSEQRRVSIVLGLGALSHLFLDAFVLHPAPFVEVFLWPLPEVTLAVPIVDLYRSTDWWLPIAGGCIALVSWLYTTPDVRERLPFS